MIQNYSLRYIAVLLIIVACPINLQGQAQLYTENQLGISRVSGHAGTGKMKLLENPVIKGEWKRVVITLIVNVDSILNLKDKEEASILPYCELSDGKNQDKGLKLKDFLTDVYGGKRVKWKASSANSGKIKIVQIVLDPHDSILFKKGRTLNRKWWRISGRVKKDKELDQEKSQYSIYFEIKKDGKSYGIYMIDPKLRANT